MSFRQVHETSTLRSKFSTLIDQEGCEVIRLYTKAKIQRIKDNKAIPLRFYCIF